MGAIGPKAPSAKLSGSNLGAIGFGSKTTHFQDFRGLCQAVSLLPESLRIVKSLQPQLGVVKVTRQILQISRASAFGVFDCSCPKNDTEF